MTEAFVLNLGQNALLTALTMAGPFLISSIVLGSLVSLFQAATQINETTLNFVPKILAAVFILLFLGSWMGNQILSFTQNIFISLPEIPF